MAFDKVVDSQALDEDLGAVADAIRSKTGSTEAMTLDQMPEAIAGIQTGGGRSRVYEITLAKASGWVLLTELDDDVLAHIDDPSLALSLMNASGYEYEYYGVSMAVASNTPQNKQGNYPQYGAVVRQNNETVAASLPIYYPLNSTATTTGLGGAAFLVDGHKYFFKPGDGFVRSGTYHLAFVW